MTLTLGSVCTGYGGLDMAVAQVLNVEPVWVADPDPGAAAILAHHWPDVPNLGDITALDWTAVPAIDVLAAGFPCQPVSHAGRRAGATDERWLWDDVARAIAILRPRLVVLENVRGLLSSPGRQPDCVCGWDHRWGRQLRHHLDHDQRPDPVLADGRRADGQASRPERAADGARRPPGTGCSAWPRAGVRGDAALGAVGGVAAVPAGGAAAVPHGEEGPGGTAVADARSGVAGLDEWARYLLDAGDLGRVAEGQGPDTGTEPAGHGSDRRGDCPACGRLVDDPADRPVRRAVGDVLWSLSCLGFDARWLTLRASDVGAPHRRERWFLLAWPAAHPADLGHERGRLARRRRARPADGGVSAADAARDGRNEGRPESARIVRRPDAALGGLSTAADADGCGRRAEPRIVGGERTEERVQADIAWGDYAAAVHRWERVLGRPAPHPTEPGRDGRPRLSPAFVEWLMGLNEGHVTDPAIWEAYAETLGKRRARFTPATARNAQLKALGNGVVPAQGAAALAELLDRIGFVAGDGTEAAA